MFLSDGIGPVTNHNLAAQTHTCANVAEFTVAMSALVEVHEVHVHGIPRNFGIILSVEVEHGLVELLQTVNPHLCGRESVHPSDHTDAGVAVVCSLHYIGNFLGRVSSAFVDNLNGKTTGFVEAFDHFFRVAVDSHNGVAAI